MAWAGTSVRRPPGPSDLVAGVQLVNVCAAEAPGTPREGRLGQACEGPPRLGTGRKDRRGHSCGRQTSAEGGTLRRACGLHRGHASHRGT